VRGIGYMLDIPETTVPAPPEILMA
jgi:hypothetical protein